VYLAGVDDGLQLQSGQQATFDSGLGDGQRVGDVRRRDTGERVGLHHDVRMRDSYRGCGRRKRQKSSLTLLLPLGSI